MIAATVTPPTAVTIAGTDSSGGAGLAADLKTFAAHRVHGAFAVTAITAQTTVEIMRVELLDPELVGAQLDALADDLDIRATKTGMLGAAAMVEAVAARRSFLGALVVDPVLVKRNGDPLFGVDVADAYRAYLFDDATVLTPNVAEAGLLVGATLTSRAEVVEAAEVLRGRHDVDVVVTGFLEGSESIDVHAGGDATRLLVGPRVDTANVQGTGCSFAASVAARLARGTEVAEAIDGAKAFVHRAIEGAAHWSLGSGQSGIDQIGAMVFEAGDE